MRRHEPPCSAEFQFGFRQHRQASRLHPLPLPLRRPVHPDAASHRELTTLPPRSTPASPRRPGRRAARCWRRAGRRSPRISISRPSSSPASAFGAQPQSDGPRTCHEMSCSVMRCHVLPPTRPSPPASPKRRPSAILHVVPPSAFRSVRAATGLPGGASLFRAYRMCSRARVCAGAVRAPDCARAERRAHLSRPFRWGFFAPVRGGRQSGLRMPLPPVPSYHRLVGVKRI